MKINRVVHLHFEDGTERMEILRNMTAQADYWNLDEIREHIAETEQRIWKQIPLWENNFQKKISCVSWISYGEEHVYVKKGE